MSDQTPLQPGWSMAEPGPAVSAFLATLPDQPRLLALGEPVHSLDAFPSWRNRLFRTLVEQHGFRSIALESDIIAGQQVNAHVTSGEGTLDEVLHTGFSHGFGARPANRELVRWMSGFNAGRDPADQLQFYGFDAPLENLWAASPRTSLLALHLFLTEQLGPLALDRATLERLCGPAAPWTNPAAGMDPAQSIGHSDEARQLRLLADDLATLLRTEAPQLMSRPGFWDAQLHARTATGLLRYHAVVADRAPTRVARMLALRDLMMADNLSAIAEREGKRGPTLVFAHNTHLQRDLSTMKLPSLGDLPLEWWGAGAHVSARLGQRYAFVAGVLGTGTAEAGPLGRLLEGLEAQVTLLAARDLPAALTQQRPDGPALTRAETLLLRADGLLLLKGA
ncbi:erythromycin esterase family protein [Deinococcus sonorensis]|uniref:Erythromycin esterase family protein n=2 Tax=Deinococcus sonorensis TaxID=309891 RepID=A0AAU7UDS4_9DEIO